MPRVTSDFHEVQLLSSQVRQFKMNSTKAFRDHARTTLIEPVVREARARFYSGSPFGVFVAPTIRGVYPTKGFPGIRAGGGFTKGGLLFYGAEFGSQGKRVRTYRTHSRAGNPYMVTRRTTRQFGRFMKEGRFLYPTVRKHAPRIMEEWATLTTQTFNKKGR